MARRRSSQRQGVQAGDADLPAKLTAAPNARSDSGRDERRHWLDDEEHRRQVEAMCAEIKRRIEAGHETWQACTRQPMPLDIDEIEIAAVRYGLPADVVHRGDYTLADLTKRMVGNRLAAADAVRDRALAAAAEEAVRRAAGAVTQGTPPPADPHTEEVDDDPAGGGQLGFLGGAELFDALDVHPSRRDAFDKQLERARRQLVIAGDCREVREPPPNTPTYLYRVSAVSEIAKAYRVPKPA